MLIYNLELNSESIETLHSRRVKCHVLALIIIMKSVRNQTKPNIIKVFQYNFDSFIISRFQSFQDIHIL